MRCCVTPTSLREFLLLPKVRNTQCISDAVGAQLPGTPRERAMHPEHSRRQTARIVRSRFFRVFLSLVPCPPKPTRQQPRASSGGVKNRAAAPRKSPATLASASSCDKRDALERQAGTRSKRGACLGATRRDTSDTRRSGLKRAPASSARS